MVQRWTSWYEPLLDLLHSSWAGRPYHLLHSSWAGRPYHLLHSNCPGPSVTLTSIAPSPSAPSRIPLSTNPSTEPQLMETTTVQGGDSALDRDASTLGPTPSPTPPLHPVRRRCVLCLCDEDPRNSSSVMRRLQGYELQFLSELMSEMRTNRFHLPASHVFHNPNIDGEGEAVACNVCQLALKNG